MSPAMPSAPSMPEPGTPKLRPDLTDQPIHPREAN
jgi:hypothetical protein